jgi:hypothetical protein
MTAGRTVKAFEEGEIRTTWTRRGDRPEYLCRECGPAKLKAWRKGGGRATGKSVWKRRGLCDLSERTKQSPTSTLVPNRLHRLYFACPPIPYSLANRSLFRADPHSSLVAVYTPDMERREQVSLVPRYTMAPSVAPLSVPRSA